MVLTPFITLPAHKSKHYDHVVSEAALVPGLAWKWSASAGVVEAKAQTAPRPAYKKRKSSREAWTVSSLYVGDQPGATVWNASGHPPCCSMTSSISVMRRMVSLSATTILP